MRNCGEPLIAQEKHKLGALSMDPLRRFKTYERPKCDRHSDTEGMRWYRLDLVLARIERHPRAVCMPKFKNPTRLTRREWLKRASKGAALLSMPGAASAVTALQERTAGPAPAPKHSEMRLLNDRPLNLEAPAHLLNDQVTRADRLFVRNNGLMPALTRADDWTLTFDWEAVSMPKTFTLKALKEEFEQVSLQMTLECGGNGRSEFDPPASGNQWTTGAVGCPKWTGVRLRDVLQRIGVQENAVYIGYYGADRHLSGDPSKSPISRGVPMHKALEPETLLAFSMNDEAIPLEHGYPLRLVVGGWPGSVCGKWLQRIRVRDRVHDGEKMLGSSYRVPCEPVARGSQVPDDAMCIIESMPVKSLITTPRSGQLCMVGRPLPIGGFAWAGDDAVKTVQLSSDFGATWQSAQLAEPVNRFAWQRFEYEWTPSKTGYFEIWAKATDVQDRDQPMVVPGWNPKGYLNNACHRIAVQVVA